MHRPDKKLPIAGSIQGFSGSVKAIAEMYRVLEPGDTALIAGMRRDAPPWISSGMSTAWGLILSQFR